MYGQTDCPQMMLMYEWKASNPPILNPSDNICMKATDSEVTGWWNVLPQICTDKKPKAAEKTCLEVTLQSDFFSWYLNNEHSPSLFFFSPGDEVRCEVGPAGIGPFFPFSLLLSYCNESPGTLALS